MPEKLTHSGPGLRVRLENLPGFTDASLKPFLPFLFQASPLEQFEWTAGHSWDDFETIGGETYSTPGSRQLRQFPFSSIFTDEVYPWTMIKDDGYTPNPLTMLAKLVRICESGTPIRLIAKSPLLYPEQAHVNSPVSLREVRPVEKAGEVDAIYHSLSFVEYRHPDLATATSTSAEGTSRVKLPVTVSIRDLPPNRQSLYSLAKFYYGSQSLWKVIAKRNGLIGVNPSTNLRVLFLRYLQKKIVIPTKPA